MFPLSLVLAAAHPLDLDYPKLTPAESILEFPYHELAGTLRSRLQLVKMLQN